MLHLLEHVKSLISAGNRVSHYLAGQVGDVHAVAGVALGVENVVIQPADMRHAVDNDADLAALFIVDAYVFQLREYLKHSREDGFPDTERLTSGIIAAAAE